MNHGGSSPFERANQYQREPEMDADQPSKLVYAGSSPVVDANLSEGLWKNRNKVLKSSDFLSCPCGGTVDTAVLEAVIERCEGAIPFVGTSYIPCRRLMVIR